MVCRLRSALLVALVPFLLALAGPPVGADHVRVESETFLLPSLTGFGNTHTRCLADANVGDVCFDVLPHEFSADLRVETPSGRAVAAQARLYDAAFAYVGWSGTFCGDMDNLLVAGAAFVVVQPLDPVNAEQACTDPPTPTGGTVTAGFH